MKSSQNPISLYIHWPYCLSKCPYCDFASSVCSQTDEDVLWQGYLRDLNRFLDSRPIATIFFGGGTPSLMSPAFLEKFFTQITEKTTILPDAEITMEANPDAIDLDKMKAFRGLGVNRLSLGVQALNDSDLKFLGRRHTVKTALKRISEAKDVFERINIDLIYARPNQTLNAWEKELKQALSLRLAHYSLYQLTIEENTVFGKKKVAPATEKTAVEMYKLTDSVMDSAGIPPYEVSNYARKGQECRHNLAYWKGLDYVGIGPAAHGRIGLLATQNPRQVGAWLKEGIQTETLTEKERELERLFMGLRLRQDWYPSDKIPSDKIEKWVRGGFLEQNTKGIRPTQKGVLILDKMILSLMD